MNGISPGFGFDANKSSRPPNDREADANVKDGHLRFAVEIYQTDLKKLEDPSNPLNPYLPKLRQLAQSGLTIHADNFVHWSLCLELASSGPLSTPAALLDDVKIKRRDLRRHVTIDGPDLRWSRGPVDVTTQYLGVGGSLSLAAAVFEFTDADISLIPVTDEQSMDFDATLSHGVLRTAVQVESKGTQDSASRYGAAASVREKKESLDEDDGAGTILRCGIIVDVPWQADGPATLTFLDPPSEVGDGDPRWNRLIRRLRYYHRALRLFYRGTLTMALADRIVALETAQKSFDWTAFDGVRLASLHAEPLELPQAIGLRIEVDQRTRFHGRPLGLSARQISRGEEPSDLFFFIGLERSVLLALAAQDFGRILDLSFEPRQFNVRIVRRQRALKRLRSGLVLSSVFGEIGAEQ